uniref:DUF555 domain-containing protein n=1 Tax=Archaeoglobus fulgidus TaxID=2234 RepID=A0A7C2NAP5_ARCFL
MAVIRGMQLRSYYVILKCPVFLENVSSVEDACNIAVSVAAKKVPHYVDVDVSESSCPCGVTRKDVLIVAGDALVSVLLGMKVVADSDRGAVRVARSIVKKAFNKSELVAVYPLR